MRLPRGAITATPRIGVDYAGPVWSQKPWRFVLANAGEAQAQTSVQSMWRGASAGAQDASNPIRD